MEIGGTAGAILAVVLVIGMLVLLHFTEDK